jgi:hypothetical protein
LRTASANSLRPRKSTAMRMSKRMKLNLYLTGTSSNSRWAKQRRREEETPSWRMSEAAKHPGSCANSTWCGSKWASALSWKPSERFAVPATSSEEAGKHNLLCSDETQHICFFLQSLIVGLLWVDSWTWFES